MIRNLALRKNILTRPHDDVQGRNRPTRSERNRPTRSVDDVLYTLTCKARRVEMENAIIHLSTPAGKRYNVTEYDTCRPCGIHGFEAMSPTYETGRAELASAEASPKSTLRLDEVNRTKEGERTR